MPHTQNSYEGSGAFNLLNDNSIPIDDIWPNDVGQVPISSIESSLSSAKFCKPGEQIQIGGSLIDCPSLGPGNSEKPSNNSTLIGVCTTIGLIIIAVLVGYSFTKRPCSRENVNSISNRANLVTQPESTIRAPVTATTPGMELTNISDVRINVANCVGTSTPYYNALVQNRGFNHT